MSTSRPFGVTLLSAYYLITGIIGVVWNLLVSVFGVVLVCFVPGMLVGGVWRLITSILSVILGASLYSGKSWAPMVGTIIAGLSALLSVLDVLNGGGLWPVINIIVNVAVILYLQSDNVKRFFATN
jgi:hypothetical protein